MTFARFEVNVFPQITPRNNKMKMVLISILQAMLITAFDFERYYNHELRISLQ